MCKLCDKILDKYKRGKRMGKKWFVLHEEVIDIFHENFHIPKIEKRSFHLSRIKIIGSMEDGKTRNDCFHANVSKIYIKLKKYYAEKFSETNGIEIQSQR